MTVPKVLIVGGGIAGPALAFWLAKAGHDVSIVERSESLRAQGQQIDIRSQAVEVVRRMGLLDKVRSKVVNEDGLLFVDRDNRPQAYFGANKTGKGAQSFTSEFEIMRGDLCRILYDATRELGVKYYFDTRITNLDQDDEAVTAYFSDASSDRYDLIVGADGQSSSVRKLIMQPEEERYRDLGCYIAYFTIPRMPSDPNKCTVCLVQDGSMALRADNPKTVQVYLGIRPTDDQTKTKLRNTTEGHDVADGKHVFTEWFSHAGWQAPRILDALNRGGVSDDFYFQGVGQVKTESWFKGRVALVGDAAYCPSPMSGMGTSAALVGAYVLAGEVAERCASSEKESVQDVPEGLRGYRAILKPFIDKAQKLPPGCPGLFYPSTEWGIWIMHLVLWLVMLLRIDRLAMMLSSDDVKGWQLPEYPSLKI